MHGRQGAAHRENGFLDVTELLHFRAKGKDKAEGEAKEDDGKHHQERTNLESAERSDSTGAAAQRRKRHEPAVQHFGSSA